MTKPAMSMVEFYLAQSFNPVFIPVEEAAVWASHVAKRRNLYERHLGLPLSLLGGREVLEFGCNSGENGLVLAAAGARLTLVEPNPQVLPRLRELFAAKHLDDRITAIHQADIQAFASDRSFDLVIAEGFLSTLEDRDAMLAKIAGLVRPMGFGVISYNDRCGGLLEMLKRAVLHRVYRLRQVDDPLSAEALAIARGLFEEDFNQLNASRSFETWWRDTLVVPVYTDRQLWSLPDILPILDAAGAVVHGTSPLWSTWESFNWYKNAPSPEEINARYLDEWRRHLAYFVTGLRPAQLELDSAAPAAAVADAAELVRTLSACAEGLQAPEALRAHGAALLTHFRSLDDARIQGLADELEGLFGLLAGTSAQELSARYLQSVRVRGAWGTAYHYLCFRKLP